MYEFKQMIRKNNVIEQNILMLKGQKDKFNKFPHSWGFLFVG